MKNKEEITLGELIYSKAFQKMLDDKIRHDFKEYDKAVAGRLVKRNPMMRLREMGAEDVKTMTDFVCRNPRTEVRVAINIKKRGQRNLRTSVAVCHQAT